MSHVEHLFQNLPAVVTGDHFYFKVNAKCAVLGSRFYAPTTVEFFVWLILFVEVCDLCNIKSYEIVALTVHVILFVQIRIKAKCHSCTGILDQMIVSLLIIKSCSYVLLSAFFFTNAPPNLSVLDSSALKVNICISVVK